MRKGIGLPPSAVEAHLPSNTETAEQTRQLARGILAAIIGFDMSPHRGGELHERGARIPTFVSTAR